MKHLLSLEKLSATDMKKILRDAVVFKRDRAKKMGANRWLARLGR